MNLSVNLSCMFPNPLCYNPYISKTLMNRYLYNIPTEKITQLVKDLVSEGIALENIVFTPQDNGRWFLTYCHPVYSPFFAPAN